MSQKYKRLFVLSWCLENILLPEYGLLLIMNCTQIKAIKKVFSTFIPFILHQKHIACSYFSYLVMESTYEQDKVIILERKMLFLMAHIATVSLFSFT